MTSPLTGWRKLILVEYIGGIPRECPVA